MKLVKVFESDHEWIKRYSQHYYVSFADVIHKAVEAAQREVQRRDFKKAENMRLRIKRGTFTK